jgi:Putative 2OG-Fe(II) oxygenase
LRLSLCEALEHGDYDAVLATCERALSVAVTNTTALHYQMVALALSHQSTQAAIEMAMERFVVVEQLDVPTEFADSADFHRQLALEVRADPTLRADPQGVATRQGWQTLSRSSASGPVMAHVLTMIEAAVQRFTRGLGDTDAHPFVRYRPNRGALQFWSVLYSDAGYQRPHYHPSGWLSGVYHASGEGASGEGAGNSTAECDPASGGALVLGDCMHLRRAKITPPWGLRTIPSRAGQLVLFPSFVPHSTRAPQAGIERLSVAFDVKRDA